ncbi:Clavaminate synthase-like protein [Polyporus arcularius HHB13444]|uniref:Clavaminate synthase-like protein n=1 Tax=Polyporus arcularius HHB13444 TaxID=1314778 RepID=A0A5C3NNT8_9APHY|nr:Clavaminate synthase-like protein [Polyporus arcularius HHB13444]
MDIRYPRADSAPSYAEFSRDYLLPNKPVIIGPSLISSWAAVRRWASEDGSINWDYMKTTYGSCEVTVADCSTRDFSDQKRNQMLFRDVVSLWQAGQGQSLYVKDWHLARALVTAGENGLNTAPFYTTPDIFRDDWMNAYYSACTDDDFRFVYVGAAGTFTPLHRDVYTSYSWSTNICGRKRWWLFPPEQTRLLFRRGGEEHLETAYDVRNVDPATYPLFSQAKPIVVEQGPGETIFVPSGWYHQVENLTACISINHNWCNSVNLPSLYDSMCAKVTEVEHALEDVKKLLSETAASQATDVAPSESQRSWEDEWIAIVQDVVEKDAGWNWVTFWRMVRHALALAMDRLHQANETLWPRTPRELMPPLFFIKERIRDCRGKFMQRPQREVALVPTLDVVLADIHQLLEATN